MEANWDPFAALGIDGIVSITTDPLDLLQQKVQDEGLRTPSLSDPDLAVSRTYEANLYGMMGTATNGHSFVLVDEAGVIRWRADYGGAPKYTMYVPTEQLLADIREGIAAAGGIA
jgi:peroxiredoxin Q/BCP